MGVRLCTYLAGEREKGCVARARVRRLMFRAKRPSKFIALFYSVKFWRTGRGVCITVET